MMAQLLRFALQIGIVPKMVEKLEMATYQGTSVSP